MLTPSTDLAETSPHVLWLINHYAATPEGSGGTRHFALARHLAEHGVRTIIIAGSKELNTGRERLLPGEQSRLEVVDGVEFLWLKTPGHKKGGLRRLISMLLFAFALGPLSRGDKLPKPDVILGSSPQPFAAMAAWWLAQKRRVPFILEVRDLWPESMVEVAGISPRHPMVKLIGRMMPWLYRRSSRIVTLLPRSVPVFVKAGAKEAAVTVIPNGIEIVPPVVAARRDTGKFTVLYAGAHGIPNYLDTLLDAAGILQQRFTSRIQIRFVGEGVCKAALEAKAREMKLSNVEFLPAVPKREVPALLASADACYLQFRDAPLYRYGVSPNKLFDYLLAAKPVLFAANVPDNPVALAEAGMVLPVGEAHALADAIQQLSAMPPEARAAMGQRGRDYVIAHHDMRALAAKLYGVIAACITERA